MKCSLVSLSLAVVAATFVLGSSDAEARLCRHRYRGGYGYQTVGYPNSACCGNNAYSATPASTDPNMTAPAGDQAPMAVPAETPAPPTTPAAPAAPAPAPRT